MKRLKSQKDLSAVLRAIRPATAVERELRSTVEKVLQDVRARGDQAVARYSKKFDGVDPRPLRVTPAELRKAKKHVDPGVLRALERSARRIREYHQTQRRKSIEVRKPGALLAQRITPIQAVGVYAPGGLAPYASTVLMDVIPAQVAGCDRIALCSSPKKEHGGSIAPVILAACEILGVDEVYRIGGVQAIGAFAYGTKSVPAVDMICGPGSPPVAEAKRQVYGIVKIDSIAGATEILIIADDSADPRFVAADLIGQVEHGSGASGILVSPSAALADSVEAELVLQAKAHPQRAELRRNLKKLCFLVQAKNMADAVRISNAIGPEHLEVITRGAGVLVPKLRNAGAIFVGPYTPEPLGDYTAGPNHVLPTGGTARFASPLNVDDFLKKTSILRFNREAMEKLAEDTIALAEAEGFRGHANAVRVRRERS